MVWLYTEYAKTHFLLVFLWASPNNGEVSVDNMGWVAMVLLLATSDYKLNTIDMVFPRKIYTGKPAHVVTSIKQSLVLKGHLFLVLS